MRRQAVVVMMLGALLLAGCTGGDDTLPGPTSPDATTTPAAAASASPSPTPTSTAASSPSVAATPGSAEVVVLDAGAEPRSVLATTTALDATVVVTASTSRSGHLGEEVDTTSGTADYRLDLSLQPDGATSLLVATPTDLTTDVDEPVPDDLGQFEWTLSPSGSILGMATSGWDTTVPPRLQTLLSFSHLVLEAPTVPVGTGARWQRDVEGGRVEVVLERLDEDELGATVQVVGGADGDELSVVSTGAWERDTLVALDVRTISEASAAREVVADGVTATMQVAQVDERHLVREPRS